MLYWHASEKIAKRHKDIENLKLIGFDISENMVEHSKKNCKLNNVKYYKKDWMKYEEVAENKTSIKEIKKSLEDAVKNQLMSDVPFGVLLSGGLDSSIVAALVKKFSQKRVESDDKQDAWWPQIHSFAIGLENSPDLEASRDAAKHIGTVHHEKTFTIEEGFDAIRDVIYFLETYDVTTIRASTPMYLLARVIRSMGIKMVLSGEGADEIFGGYLYFHKAPNAKEFHKETVRKLDKLHFYDCLRANKSMAAWGVECRVPFLDKDFLDVSMSINPKDKMVGNIEELRYDLHMEAFLNNKLISSDNFKNISWSFSDMIERASYGVDLVPGDLIGSGTCATGCLLEINQTNKQNLWLKDGDTIRLSIDELGILENKVSCIDL